MTIKKLVSELCKEEGKKSQISVGNMREIVKIICKKMFKDPDVHAAMIIYGSKLNK